MSGGKCKFDPPPHYSGDFRETAEMLRALAIHGYRSLRDLVIPLSRLNVITGANGSGKSSLYRALRLLADTAQGGVISSLAREGGLQSTLWAGPEVIGASVRRGDFPVQPTVRRNPVALRLGFSSDEFGYLIDLGFPATSLSFFSADPEIKRESIWHGPLLRPSTLLVERQGPIVKVRSENEDRQIITDRLASFDSMMTQVGDPLSAPEMLTLRESIRAWRFYDHFRTDSDSSARASQIGTRTPVLNNEGLDLAAAIQTIREIGDGDGLTAAVDDAFPGSSVYVENHSGRFSLLMKQYGLLRPLSAAELSDGTLRYLLLVAALMTPRPPALMVLNEPETSLHPDLLAALARLIARAVLHSQLIVVTHSPPLISALNKQPDCNSITLEKSLGETSIRGADRLGRPAWHWPSR
jgi:predicted ATPase